MDISLGQGGESHGRLVGKLKGKPIGRVVAGHWLLLMLAAPGIFFTASSTSSLPMFPCISCGRPIEKPPTNCCDPSKSMLSEALLTSPNKELHMSVEGVFAVHLAGGPENSRGENTKPLGMSPFEDFEAGEYKMEGR